MLLGDGEALSASVDEANKRTFRKKIWIFSHVPKLHAVK